MNFGRCRRRVKPSLAVPLLLAAALLGLALSLGDLGRVLARVGAIPVGVMGFVLLLAGLYLLAKLGQFYLLLAYLGLYPGRRRLWVAFAVGELAVTLPFGVFAQNWLLTATGTATPFGRSSAATVVMLLAETLVVLLWLALAGVPGWPELRPAAIAGAAGLVVFVSIAPRLEKHIERQAARRRYRWLRYGLYSALDLLRGGKQLASSRLLLANVAIAAAYLGALAAAFTAVGRGVGLGTLDYPTAATIYAFSLAVVLIGGGVLSQIGTVEVLGMGAAQAFGFDLTDGLALMLAFRLLWTGAIWLLNLPVVIVFWRAVWRTDKLADDVEKTPD